MPAPRTSVPRRGTVLVLEDNATLAEETMAVLRAEGITCVPAATIDAAWRQLRDGGLDALVSDFDLPDGTAADLVQRCEEQGRGIPTVIVSGADPDRLAGLRDSPLVHDILHKPVAPPFLRQAVCRLLTGVERHPFRRTVSTRERALLLNRSTPIPKTARPS